MGVLGVPLPILLIAVPIFPLIVLIGLAHQRRADRLDQEFRDLMADE
jgi:hypothetical protein